MATPADERLLELLDKWLGSLEQHLRYASLDDDSYWKAQAWVEHQRPSRWIVELAKQKALALRAQVVERSAAGDATFSDSVELTIFLANLVGSEHIERFIPIAEPRGEQTAPAAAPAAAPAPAGAPARAPAPAPPPAEAATGTREMPKFLAAKPRAEPPGGGAQAVRVERRAGAAARQRAKSAPAAAAAPKLPASDAARAQVLADAERLIQWGRKWYELPELIARMADRPPLAEVRRILKDHKPHADKKAGA
jgi:hypothetical protein